MASGVPPGVHVGRDGWLFWVGRSGETAALYAESWRMRWTLWRWTRLIERRARRAAALGARYVEVVVPDKLSIEADRLSSAIIDPCLAPGRRLGEWVGKSRAADAWVDLFGPLDRARAGTDVFFKTDTHWTFPGCLAGYAALCEACGLAPAANVAAAIAREPQDYLFDTGRKLVPPVKERATPYEFAFTAKRVDANALVRFREERDLDGKGGFYVGSRSVYLNEAPGLDPRRVVLFGDSFSLEFGYTFATTLAESFRELHVIWSANIDWRYVEVVRPDLVVHEIAERFLRRVPHDRFSVDRFAEGRVRRAKRAGL